jgi:hypothetical protein
LAGTHRQTAVSLESALREALERRARVAAELEFQSRAYVSDASERVATRAAERARLIEQLHRYEDYLRLFARMEKTSADIGRLELRIEEQRSELALAESRRADIRERFKFLNKRLEQLLNEFNAPRSAEKRAAYVDPLTYLPIVDGRSFDNLHSPGLSVQVNVAYALANHLAALRFDLPLPGILLIDGFTSNIGTEGEDPDRRHRMYQYMIELSRRRGKDLQVIIADNDVPEFAQAFVRATLSQSDRLIPVVVRRSQRNRAILRPPNDGS